ncbi:PUL domain [Trypanosoma melophagium]|uniref:PUL domain n=1 Tax=Trypanosoma melophagium TaxID=715481 RepID=UPI00351AAA5F|nr:PUL domain [Trypanosoma melophagium]
MTETAPSCFVLRADGQVHASDVRHVSSNVGRIATASRDHTATVRSAILHGDDVPAGCTLVGHTAFVNFALLYPAAPLLDGRTAVVTGGNDGHIALWDADTGKLEAVLSHHTQGVCCGAITCNNKNKNNNNNNNNNTDSSSNGEVIVTGDWGGVCIVFDGSTGRVHRHYTGHKTAVRGITVLPETTNVVSVSGDTTVHRWDMKSGETLSIYKSHKDAVQCVCAMSSTRFASAGNDATIIVWDTAMGTTPMCVLAAHDSSIYGLCYCTERRMLFSAAEDHTVKVWCGGVVDITTTVQTFANTDAAAAVVQSISHPCVVWSVCVTETGDITTGGSDGILRIWTTKENNMASVEKLQALEEAVAAQTFDVKVVGLPPTMDTSSLPWVDELQQRQGRVEGERLIVRSDSGLIEVYTWNCGRWDKLGTVVSGPDGKNYTGAPQAKPKVYHNGVPHDYVFDVDVNGKMLKLTYDKGQSIFDAAQNFIDANSHVVSQTHKEEIQNFILNNVDPQDLQSGEGNPVSASAGLTSSTTDVGSNSNNEPVFSEFAREAAAMRQAGNSHTPSWTEALRNLESAGVSTDAVAFSGYAREQIELEKQRAAAAAAGGGGGPVGSFENEQRNIAIWDSFKFFTTFNATGAQAKINELTGDAQFHKLVEEVITAAKSEPSVALIDAIIALYYKLPESSRFPAIDLLSHLLAIASCPFEWLLLLLGSENGQSTTREFMQERVVNIRKAPDAEFLVTLRLFAHAVAALDKASPTACLTVDQRTLLLTALTKAPQPLLRTTKNNIKISISAIMRNTAVILSRHSAVFGSDDGDGAEEVAGGLVRLVAQWLIFEPSDSPYTRDLLSTVLTLVQNSSTNKIAAVAVEVGRSTLGHTMRVLKECGEPQCREAAANIINIFNETESH